MPRPFFIPLPALLLVLSAGAEAAEPMSGHATLAGKQVPLPAGEWVLAGSDGAGHQGSAPFQTAVFMQLDGRQVRAFVIATTNAEPGTAGWGLTRDCSRREGAFAAIDYASAIDGACRFVGRVATGTRPGTAPAWTAAAEMARQQGWTVPDRWLMAGVRLTDRRDVIDVRYHFADGTPQAAVAWSAQALSAVQHGLHGRLGAGDALSMPNPASAAPAAVPPPAEPVSPAATGEVSWGTSLMKTLSWRAVGTVGDLAVAYLFTGDPVLSGGLAATGAVVNSVLYFGHELAWGYSSEGPPMLEFPGASSGSGSGSGALP
ncbi:putative membrane protein [Azospirillum lipoferum]|uniref:DUF2061 domain-containing protein n=1 Tax=Azospirillum lipoferum TaxID=193 RepID=A0A5A9GMU5_AZOLI|nr:MULTISPECIES: DUF2061 domain-containing protein [Azospirillum]KAA0595736.1 DUF2061 domain-containing protein [Azospirillum lipoferum]MCP1611395.1 putative membrane protein [Azospirillum lipoferum]MDW5537198.1 DUF2061 domain-containing protein [Azospirillum sp. NL1]